MVNLIINDSFGITVDFLITNFGIMDFGIMDLGITDFGIMDFGITDFIFWNFKFCDTMLWHCMETKLTGIKDAISGFKGEYIVNFVDGIKNQKLQYKYFL